MSTRQELLYVARICQQTERYQDMLDAMKKVVAMGGQLSSEQRNLLSVAYKNSIGPRRSAWRALVSIEKKQGQKHSKNLGLLIDYKKNIENELNKFCSQIINLLDSTLIPKASSSQGKVFYLKMKGDYYRYITQYTTGQQNTNAGNFAGQAYGQASDKAKTQLKTTHPIRLGLALNYSVYYYQVKNDPKNACTLAKQAFDDAIADIEQIDEDQYKDATSIMQLIRDNLTLWTSQLEEGGQDS